MDYSTAVILNVRLESQKIFEDELWMLDLLHDSPFMSGPSDHLDVAFSFWGGIGAGTKKWED